MNDEQERWFLTLVTAGRLSSDIIDELRELIACVADSAVHNATIDIDERG